MIQIHYFNIYQFFFIDTKIYTKMIVSHFRPPLDEILGTPLREQNVNLTKENTILVALLRILSPITIHNIQNSSRKLEVLFAQLRLESTRLNSSLFKIRQTDYPLFSDCPVPETITHYFFVFGRFQNQRYTLERKLREINITVLSLETLLNDPRILRITEQFIVSSKRFE